jgi:hypothetical protein
MNSVLKEVFNDPGYSVSQSLHPEELRTMKTFINEQWKSRIYSFNGSEFGHLLENGMNIASYSIISDLVPHSRLWPKEHRILDLDFIQWFESSEFYILLRSLFGSLYVSDEENLGRPNYYWRICRPNKEEDVGPVHRDSWFWECDESQQPADDITRVKVWIPVYLDIGRSGLMVSDNSHTNQSVEWTKELRHGRLKPLFVRSAEPLNMHTLLTPPGQAIIFNDNLLHCGAVNRGKTTRVSLEFTMIVPESVQ